MFENPSLLVEFFHFLKVVILSIVSTCSRFKLFLNVKLLLIHSYCMHAYSYVIAFELLTLQLYFNISNPFVPSKSASKTRLTLDIVVCCYIVQASNNKHAQNIWDRSILEHFNLWFCSVKFCFFTSEHTSKSVRFITPFVVS